MKPPQPKLCNAKIREAGEEVDNLNTSISGRGQQGIIVLENRAAYLIVSNQQQTRRKGELDLHPHLVGVNTSHHRSNA